LFSLHDPSELAHFYYKMKVCQADKLFNLDWQSSRQTSGIYSLGLEKNKCGLA